jgi:hypothetical protein
MIHVKLRLRRSKVKRMMKIVLRGNSKAGMIMLCLVTVLFGFFFGQNSALAQGCPPVGIVTDSFVGSEPTMTDRLYRDDVASQCIPPKAFPTTLAEENIYKTYSYTNVGNVDACVTVNFDVGTCDVDVFASAYLEAFDPTDLASNYVGDLGSSETRPFQFVVPANRTFVLVTNSVFGPPFTSCTYSFAIAGLPCQRLGVPTLTNWGLTIFALLIIGSAVFIRTLRRRAA